MTYISETTTASGSTYQNTDSGSIASELQDQFMKLLLVQLDNQDPLNPMDSDTFVSQLCDLSQLEQSTITNDYLENLDSAVNNLQTVSYIGKSVNVEGDTVNIAEDNAGDISFSLSDEAAETYIDIYDDDGNTIWSKELPDLSSGNYTIPLDDIDESIAGGSYTFSVSAYDEEGNGIDVTTYSSVEITGVTYEDGVPYLVAGSDKISLDDVTEIHQS